MQGRASLFVYVCQGESLYRDGSKKVGIPIPNGIRWSTRQLSFILSLPGFNYTSNIVSLLIFKLNLTFPQVLSLRKASLMNSSRQTIIVSYRIPFLLYQFLWVFRSLLFPFVYLEQGKKQ